MEPRELFQISNDIIKRQLDSVCRGLTDEQVRYANPAVDDRGLSNVVVHLYWSIGNRARALLGMEREAPPDMPLTTGALLTFIDTAHRRAAQYIDQITEDHLRATVKLPYAEMPGPVAMMDGFSHAFRHIGNVLDARHLGGFETHALG